MFKRAWFSSLYSRIVFGFIALLAVLLLTQGLLFLWLTGRFEERPQGQTAQQLADFVARELSDALTVEPALDLDTFMKEELAAIRRRICQPRIQPWRWRMAANAVVIEPD